jgi:nitrite reductase/ring-hydroxylating ferredoxin subunit
MRLTVECRRDLKGVVRQGGTAVSEWVEVATMTELARRKKKLVSVGDAEIALFLVDGRVHALHDTCIHKQRSLHKGTIMRGRVICPGHQWAFDLETGWVEDQEQCQPTYAVRVEGEAVFVDATQRVLAEAPD